jgi:2,4-dienoyl-CoA reductase-like NADH-dependent reductase (Old Yellow Enzyme family)
VAAVAALGAAATAGDQYAVGEVVGAARPAETARSIPSPGPSVLCWASSPQQESSPVPADDRLLFTPIRIGTLTIAGRLIKTATAETRATDDGHVTPELIDFYVPIAQGGTPLIITGDIYVGRDGKSAPRQLGADHDDKIPGLERLTAAVHAHGAKVFAQLNPCGRQVVPRFAGLAEAVSASAKTEILTGTRPRALTLAEIEHLVVRYADAAERCRKAGFDGVQIHAANGYLMGQFLTPYTNRRTDAYGGAVEGRTRLLHETIRAIKARCGAGFPVIVKMNGSVAVVFNLVWRRREGFNLRYTREFKPKLRIPVICVGGFLTRAAMETAIARGECDIVSAGRAFIADPLLYRHLRDDEPGPRCVDCNACIGHLGAQPADCYHPRVRAEKDAMLARAA